LLKIEPVMSRHFCLHWCISPAWVKGLYAPPSFR
jgi:hypothetical protein